MGVDHAGVMILPRQSRTGVPGKSGFLQLSGGADLLDGVALHRQVTVLMGVKIGVHGEDRRIFRANYCAMVSFPFRQWVLFGLAGLGVFDGLFAGHVVDLNADEGWLGYIPTSASLLLPRLVGRVFWR